MKRLSLAQQSLHASRVAAALLWCLASIVPASCGTSSGDGTPDVPVDSVQGDAVRPSDVLPELADASQPDSQGTEVPVSDALEDGRADKGGDGGEGDGAGSDGSGADGALADGGDTGALLDVADPSDGSLEVQDQQSGEGGEGDAGADVSVCSPGTSVCVGEEVHPCTPDGQVGLEVIETCDPGLGMTCAEGKCQSACELALVNPSNLGCEFFAADLDQQDAFNDPASAPWGVVLSNAGKGAAVVTIEINEAPPGQPLQLSEVKKVTVQPGTAESVVLPTRELDCGTKPNDYYSPGTCLSSRAVRITSSLPIAVYQYNVFANSYSNDASLLLPTHALGSKYRVLGWGAGHPILIEGPGIPYILDRSYVTVVGVHPDTQVVVTPSWRIAGNPPIQATEPGGEISVKLGPFDVLNLETANGTLQDAVETMADLSGTLVQSTKPVAVFAGVESAGVPGAFKVPTFPGWQQEDSCCLDHLEEQLFPVEAIGLSYVVARSPVRSTSGFREPDVIRFVGAEKAATVKTSLPAPFDSFSLAPGEVKTTWAQNNFVVEATAPVLVGQLLVSGQFCQGAQIGDPSLTLMPSVDQFRSEYLVQMPAGWNESWIVLATEVGTTTLMDGLPPAGCTVEPAGQAADVAYESIRCKVSEGVHSLSGSKPFGVVVYGYGTAGSYAFAAGAMLPK